MFYECIREAKMIESFGGWAIRKWELSMTDVGETVNKANVEEDKSKNPFLGMPILKQLFNI